MAEELKQTKIPRFESGSSSSLATRIPKPGGFIRPPLPGISKLIRPQATGIALTTRTSIKTESNPISEELSSNPFPRKTHLRRFGVANKVQIKTLPRLRNTNSLRATQLLPSQNDVCTLNETMDVTKGTAMNLTKPVIQSEKNIDVTMDRALIRSNTFVCDDTEAKLSVPHNIPIASVPTSQLCDTINPTNIQLNKERTFKRSLSPIPGEPMNSAKRKLMQVSSTSSLTGQKVMSASHMMPMNSTPRRSITYVDARNSNLTFFGGKSSDFCESQVDQLQTFTFDNTTFESNNHFVPDATKLGSASNATMHSNNRVMDLTQTVERNDAFYSEAKNRNLTQTLSDANVAEHELKCGDSSKPNITTTICSNDADGNLTKNIIVEKTQPIQIVGSGAMSDELLLAAKKRFSLGLELPECTLDCSIELCDSSAATSAQDSSPLVNYNPHSYDMDESLGILTPDQMIEFLDTNATNMKIELPTSLPVKIGLHKCHIDQTPSPEDLPLDTIEVKTIDLSKMEEADVTLQPSIISDHDGPSQTDSYTKTDQMTKSTTSKVTNSFITSVTSIASLDNGYHADGEMSRPASRGAESPMRRVHNARQNKLHMNDENVPVVRRPQDPMTDSDFFTESDADVDIFHRGGDRRVQIIDGHMYNAQGADVFIDEAQPENEMESSGVYTDVEHRDDSASNLNLQNENESDMSPDGSTDTIKSSEYANSKECKKSMPKTDIDNNLKQMQTWSALPIQSNQSIAAMSNSSSTTINDSTATCLCEKPNIDDGGGDHAQLVISESSLSSSQNIEKTSCKLHLNVCSDNDNSNSKTAAPKFKSSTPKVKRFSPNRKQCKSDTGSGHSKRNESIGKRESKTIGVKNRSSVVTGNIGIKKSLSSTSSPGSKSPIENGQNSNCENANTFNMTSDHQSPIAVHVRKTVPNKWDAVMNKIALNKAEVKTVKYSQVKSKVTCGIKRGSPNLKANEQQSTTSDSGNSSLISTKSSASPTITRQSSHGIAKRSIERDSSKDSHLSSSRDSAVATTPGKQSKPTTSSARSSTRKRSSVQNGFSPSDIKIDTTTKADPSAKSVTLHKRFPANNNLQTTSSSPVSEKRATITASKKSSSTSKHVNQTSTPVANKTSHAKEHGLQSTLTHPSTINNNNSSINNNNHSSKSGTNSSKLGTNDDHQPLIATIHRNGKSSATIVNANKAVAVPQINTKSTGKSTSRTSVNGESNANLIEFSIGDSIDGDSTGCYASATVSPKIIDKTITRNSNQQQKQHTAADLNVTKANKTIAALSILIQHLTTNLNAFETPSLRAALETAKDKLLQSQNNLETMRTKCNYLGEQMVAKEKFYVTLKETNERELEKIKLSLRDTEKSAQEQIKLLQYELAKVNQQNIDALKSCQMKADRRCSELETQLQLAHDRELELVERLNNFTVTENQLRDKVQASEQEFSERLIAVTARERELNEKVAQLMRQLKISDDKRLELEEKFKLACDETNALRHRRNSYEHSIQNGSSNSVQNQSNSSAMLEEEVLSLRSVLDMKLNEISELRKQNQSMVQAQDELPKAQLKISILESRLEDLTIQLKTKVEEEQDLSVRNRSLQEMFNQEVKNRTRLALHNEELQWKLKQNSEKYTTTLSELSKSYQDPSLLSDFKNSLYAPISETSQESNDTTLQSTSSPPTSPVVKGVVEKCDSVSYVLELNDEESAEAVASRVVKRAGSFRVNNFKERSPSFKRQYSLGGANALSQSASATSLSRQHSDSPVKTIGGIVKLQKGPRTRSYSLNASNEPKKTQRVTMDVTNSDYTKWQKSMKTISTSSPLTTSRKYKTNGLANGLLEIDDDNLATISSTLSTDDVDLVKDFMPTQRNRTTLIPAQNTIKKRQQIKESAGEAMVSQLSEDDQSFGSVSTSTSSSSAASPSHSEASKHRHLSLDEEAFMNKIVASLSTRSTPMEVSWSEDGDNEPYAQESSA